MHKSKFTNLLVALIALRVAVAGADTVSERITVSVRGQGPDVVLIPGLASSSAVWDETARRLEKHYRLHLVQVAGFAGSPSRANAAGPIIQPTIAALDAYVKTNHLQKPAVIGHSLGGLIGMQLAIEHPADVGKLMIVDSLPFFSVLFGAKDADAAAPQAAGMRDSILAQTQETYSQTEGQFLRSMVKSAQGRQDATHWAVTSDKSVVARALYDDMTTDLRPTLSKIAAPVTILYAWDSSTGFPQATCDGVYRENYASLPNKKLVRVDDSYHFIMLDQPELFAKQVERFLND
jgi:pimeloyl-ACP methyl ester carboxylesterase